MSYATHGKYFKWLDMKLDRLLSGIEKLPELRRLMVTTCVQEALQNALEHGNGCWQDNPSGQADCREGYCYAQPLRAYGVGNGFWGRGCPRMRIRAKIEKRLESWEQETGALRGRGF